MKPHFFHKLKKLKRCHKAGKLLCVLWLVFMVTMILHLFPTDKRSMALRKSEEAQYIEVPGYSELELYRFVQEQNLRAWMVMLGHL